MPNRFASLIGLVGLIVPDLAAAADPPKFEFRDGDRVVLIGDTLIERDQSYGYLETFLTLANPTKTITFRNLGWSGDTVFGDARARFGTPADGFQHLKEHVLALQPTVILVGYGMTDSFAGEAGLPKFVAGLKTLLDVLAETRARLILLSPIAHEDLGRPLPDPAGHNKVLGLYTAAIREAAQKQGARFVNIFPLDRPAWEHWTDDGIHLTEYGYYRFAEEIYRDLSALPPRAETKEIGYLAFGRTRLHAEFQIKENRHVNILKFETLENGLRFTTLDSTLPYPPRPLTDLDSMRGVTNRGIRSLNVLRVEGLPGILYTLKVDGTEVAKPSTYILSMKFLRLSSWKSSDVVQVERLRKTINEKNQLYFYRWRPQNETYLFGFRKKEQGNNAREIPLFDPLVEEKEKEIARLRLPVPHVYELVRESGEEK